MISKLTRLTDDRRRWVALFVVCLAQLMIVLDTTIVNVALPSIQRSLHFSSSNLQWVISAYTLAFGGLLLFGGRLGDVLGRRRMFVAGLPVFSIGSPAGGLATLGSAIAFVGFLVSVTALRLAPPRLEIRQQPRRQRAPNRPRMSLQCDADRRGTMTARVSPR
jgi:MFS family permease